MRLRFCDAYGADGYRAMIESEDGQTEFLYSRTIPGLREIVLGRINPSGNYICQVDELFESLLDSEVAFAKQWLFAMSSQICRFAA